MKLKKIIATTLIMGFISASFISCEDYLDVNENPNYPTDATLQTLLPSVGATTIAQIGLNGALIGTLWMQHATQGNSTNQYNSLANYNITVSSYNAFWSNAYANTLQDIKILLTIAEEENAWNYWLIAKVLEAYNYHFLTDLYGDIPFTEALQASEFPYPKYDDSKTVVYPGIIAMLDEAIAKESQAKANSNPPMGNEDYYFRGDISKWVAFAKSLKLKVLMRDFEANKSQISSIVEAGGLLEDDCAMTAFEDATNKGNPFYEYNIRQLNTVENVRACHTFTEFLIEANDPRIEQYYELTNYAKQQIAAGEAVTLREMYGGLPCGTKPSTTEGDEDAVPLIKSSRYLQAYDDPAYLMNNAEVAFMKAEAYARMGDKAKAKAAYDNGVTKAFARWGYDASSFIASGGVYAFKDASTNEMVKCILTQKWVASAKANSWDAFFDRNRTGYPEISKVEKVRVSNITEGLMPGYELGTLVDPGSTELQPGAFPRRMLVPQGSSAYNPNAPETKGLTEPMWWHKQ
ncbi:hypothetical protein M2459_001212 [Parabacteroides sp. PF5-5]|uniref:SusD/RagB family nutrient-binding outer membrane lipoprotein n=1 Tax=unclassified Parabacteroides TaxID=2649774 RepID=UPI0024752DFE|nr:MULTISPECIES: SusD/RagB family nutrient-binding outer membrane lipoprotein [unclassified Parabacteroides]MDH6304479.1 hypothetical protein [Parabacteroides sp. PH5-39]MDH6315368.1 hypothetical protein [Parabacteroides sp. PF5-13]MDH6319138.1 hypothetical protein [Parabacteroides sp. PH5-13]MDH6322868.1 hypothetical protein [Parabacteroides sp. PH5-8]MDH6326560.1 hypothetical protein [Parabacteroides sp. PH5-41]